MCCYVSIILYYSCHCILHARIGENKDTRDSMSSLAATGSPEQPPQNQTSSRSSSSSPLLPPLLRAETNPTEFSFYLAAHLPSSDMDRLKLLQADDVASRLLWVIYLYACLYLSTMIKICNDDVMSYSFISYRQYTILIVYGRYFVSLNAML